MCGLPDPNHHPAQRRERALRLTVAASAGAKVFSILCTFVQVRIAVRYLGSESYGLWVTLVSVVAVLNFVDFGLGVGMQHAMADAFGREDEDGLRRAFWSGAAVLGVLAGLVLALGLPLALLGSWSDLLHIKDPELRPAAGWALAIALVSFATALPLNAASRLVAALQRGWIHAGWIAGGSALSLAFVGLAAHLRWGFLPFLAGALMVPTVQGTGLLLHLRHRLGWPWLPGGLASASALRALVRSSLLYALPQLGMALVQSLPPIAITVALGPSAVTGFNLLMRLLSPVQQGQVLLLTPVWPAYTEARARGDHPWVSKTFARTHLMLAPLGIASAVITWQSPRLLELWIGSSVASPAPALLAAALGWVLVQMCFQPFMYLLVGTGRLGALARTATPGLLVGSAALFLPMGSVASHLTVAGALMALTLLPPVIAASVAVIRDEGRDLETPP